jgi:hypothetical protein
MSAIVRRDTGAGEQQHAQIVTRRAARGGLTFLFFDAGQADKRVVAARGDEAEPDGGPGVSIAIYAIRLSRSPKLAGRPLTGT